MKQVLQALINAAKEVSYVQKKGYNDFQKYSYATEADVLEVVVAPLLDIANFLGCINQRLQDYFHMFSIVDSVV